MTAFNGIKAIGTMLRKQFKKNCKETKEFLPLSFDRLIFTYSDIITSNTVPC